MKIFRWTLALLSLFSGLGGIGLLSLEIASLQGKLSTNPALTESKGRLRLLSDSLKSVDLQIRSGEYSKPESLKFVQENLWKDVKELRDQVVEQADAKPIPFWQRLLNPYQSWWRISGISGLCLSCFLGVLIWALGKTQFPLSRPSQKKSEPTRPNPWANVPPPPPQATQVEKQRELLKAVEQIRAISQNSESKKTLTVDAPVFPQRMITTPSNPIQNMESSNKPVHSPSVTDSRKKPIFGLQDPQEVADEPDTSEFPIPPLMEQHPQDQKSLEFLNNIESSPSGFSFQDEDEIDVTTRNLNPPSGHVEAGPRPKEHGTLSFEKLDSQKDEIQKLLLRGYTASEISRRLRISQDQVELIAKLRGGKT